MLVINHINPLNEVIYSRLGAGDYLSARHRMTR
jgi:hypothetical protein